MPELLPIRHERMRASPFGFYRGAAAVMAADLACVPLTGLRVQLCGDAHLANFGGFATPERRLVFDVNDFDETLAGTWEWDVLRLATSLEIAARARAFRKRIRSSTVGAVVRSYRFRMLQYSRMPPLDVWYSHIDASRVAELARVRKMGAGEHVPPKLVRDERGNLQFVPNPPLVEPLDDDDERCIGARATFASYRETLPPQVRVLLDRFTLVRLARKVVGVGSVGTRCLVALFSTDRGEPLVLQLKEATASALEAYLPRSTFANHAERVVVGQHLMQAASDAFLGWTRSADGHDFYVRQLRDMKMTVALDRLDPFELEDYGAHCGWTLARAHARTGNAQHIAAYLGRSDAFDLAVTAFAARYADQNERDYETYVKASP